MIKASIGIDCGSAACKGVLLQEDVILASCSQPTGWSPRETSQAVLEQLLTNAGLERENVNIVATGYGRVGIEFANQTVTEITCHALGADYLLPGVHTVIDIGGQDSKVIAVEAGQVRSFQMNTKCAAGTGRFLEMSANRMGIGLAEFSALLSAGKSCSLSSMCAVFADSEIVSQLAAGKSREEVAGGIVQLVVDRTVALAARVEYSPPILLTGGLADMQGVRIALEKQTGYPVVSLELSRFAGAIGAARTYWVKRARNANKKSNFCEPVQESASVL
ncbi:Activator of (R)-2-hydroxyglutaryl-CoA dehydratase [Sporomusa ovata DSM 2662]|uniref:Benzoyl-CoA reductase subunit BadG n=1 Tax=Sporomusa ovata TaxID=2378 RepID=A0A0U1KV85_9FIRM|nr:acyl-CoA dehydratase activase [Sporomusa ovata]EQB27093.1 activator of (R)-2-hydroxyglutaryl-CoA dehydratase [Sporomusa ovata DSM 2662]CQR71195.1 Benzoyl-CoA reductase subunit BadG [Sporomusa ovata]